MTTPPECSLHSTCWRTEVNLLSEDFAKTVIPVLFFMAVFMISGIVGNIILLVVFTKKKAKTSADYYVLILGYIDLCSCLLVHPYMMFKLTHNYLQDWGWLCKLFEFFAHLNLAASVCVFTAIAVDRFYAVCRPLKYRNTLPLMKILLAAILPWGFIISFPILEFVGDHVSSIRSLNGSYEITTIACKFQNSYSDSLALTAFRVTTAIAFLVTAIVIAVLYTRVSIAAYRRARARVKPTPLTTGAGPRLHSSAAEKPGVTRLASQRNVKVSVIGVASHDATKASSDANQGGGVRCEASASPALDVSQSGAGSTAEGKVTHKCAPADRSELGRCNTISKGADDEAKITTTVSVNSAGRLFQKSQNKPQSNSSSLHAAKMLFAVIASFFISWSPYWIFVVLGFINENFWVMHSTADIVGYQLLIHLYYINNSLNPVIFALYHKQFRDGCRDIFQRPWCRRC